MLSTRRMYIMHYLCQLGMYGSMLPVDVFPNPGSGFPLYPPRCFSFLTLVDTFRTWLVAALKMVAILSSKALVSVYQVYKLITQSTIKV
jgi:hypothetical protein